MEAELDEEEALKLKEKNKAKVKEKVIHPEKINLQEIHFDRNQTYKKNYPILRYHNPLILQIIFI